MPISAMVGNDGFVPKADILLSNHFYCSGLIQRQALESTPTAGQFETRANKL